MQVVGSNLEVDAYHTAHLGVELHAHTEVVYQTVVVPTQVEVIFGSGLLADSNEEDEWNETEAKMETMRRLFEKK